MRILFVADEYPWPARSGYRQRLDHVLRTLAREGEVDFLAVVHQSSSAEGSPPADIALSRLSVVATGSAPPPLRRRLLGWALGRRPRALLRRSWDGPRAVLAGWSDPAYDLVWFSHAPAYLAMRDCVPGQQVVDLDNLESSFLRHRRLATARSARSSPAAARGRMLVRAAADAVDERRWRRLEHRIAAEANVVVVCSDLDRQRMGATQRVRVVPNGYERPDRRPPNQAARVSVERPVFLMVGLLTYEPNRDAVAFFAREVLPLVRQTCPEAQLRVVGRFGSEGDVAALRGVPGVTVTGEVSDVAPELAAADVVVVPIRFGGGTRIKILEAFAFGVPVVSTSVGCEGLDAVDGQQLLVADSAADLARACVRLVVDDGLRSSLITAAFQLWESSYRWERIAPAIVGVVDDARADHPT